MKILILSNDILLKNALEDIGCFNQISLTTNFDDIKNDFNIILISDMIIPYNELSIFHDKFNKLLSGKHIFYMLSNYHNESIIDNVKSICASKNINIIPPKRTHEHIKNIILKTVMPGTYIKNQNIITFVGADHKAGTTMIATTIAELIANNTNSNVLLIHLNKEPSTYYIKHEEDELYSLSNLRLKLTNNILTSEEIINSCIKLKENFYVLPGVNTISETRYYLPEHIEYLLKLATDVFHTIIIDAGSLSELDLQGGMTIAALTMSHKNYLITTQQDICYKQFDRINNQSLSRLGIFPSDFLMVLNNFYDFSSSYSPSQIADRYKILLADFIPYLELKGWQAEFDNCTLYNYNDRNYVQHMNNLLRIISEQLSLSLFNDNITSSSKWSFKSFFNKV